MDKLYEINFILSKVFKYKEDAEYWLSLLPMRKDSVEIIRGYAKELLHANQRNDIGEFLRVSNELVEMYRINYDLYFK